MLDACAGAGASPIPAAERVGPSGRAVAVDLAANLLDLTRSKADRLGLTHLQARLGDVEALDYPPASFDAVTLVFGLFFLPATGAGLETLWQLVRVHAVSGRHELRSAEGFWTIVRGSGYRATHDVLSPSEREAVHARTIATLVDQEVTVIETNVIYAVAARPL